MISKRFKSREIGVTWSVLEKLDKVKLGVLFGCQLLLSFLDLVGIAIFGLLGALAVNGVSYKAPGSRLLVVLKFLQIETLDFRIQAAILGILATVILVVRTILAIILTRKTIGFLGRKSARLTRKLFVSIMNSDYQVVKNTSSGEWIVGLTKGVNSLTIRVIGGLISMASDLFLLVLIFFGLLVFNFQIAFLTLSIFGSVAISMYLLIRQRAHYSGYREQQLDILINQRITESVIAFREIFLRNDQEYYAKTITKLREDQIESQTVSSFFPLLSRYVFEAIVVVGTLLVGAIQFLLFDAVQAVTTLSVFMAASSRIAPAVMRIQQSAIVLRASIGASVMTIRLIEELGLSNDTPKKFEPVETEGFSGDISIKNLDFRYREDQRNLFSGLSLEIEAGGSVAIVGPTGSGKSTLADLVLGVLEPNSGQVLVSGRPVREIVREFPGKISCVPQQIAIFNSSIADNVGLGSSSSSQDHAQIWQALETAELSKFVRKLPGQLDYVVSDQGANLSGGQVQRLGIARAIVTNPSIIVMDEATSALDGQTETAITNAVTKLSKKMTVIIVAHRLSTIRNVERVIYLDSGQIIADGTIAEVRKLVPSFDDQCNKMGI